VSAELEVGSCLGCSEWAASRRLRAGPPLRVPSSLVALAQSLHRATGLGYVALLSRAKAASHWWPHLVLENVELCGLIVAS